MPSASTPGHRRLQQQSFSPNIDTFRSSPRNSPLNKLNIDPKNVDCLQLCMDVPFLDHPYLIGPRGRKSQYFMTRYKSLLHFPDTNCRTDGLKLNNVLISGSMKNVEEIRAQIRLRTPIRVIVQLAHFANPRQLISRVEEVINERSLPIRFNVSEDMSNGVLKTEWRNEELLVEFCKEYINAKQLKSAQQGELLTLGIALLPLINPWNHELSHRLIGNLYEQTGCRIFYPPKEKYAVQPPTYFIKGPTMSGILQAGKYLTGLSMLQIAFYMPPGVVPTIQQQQLDDWQRDLLVHTTIYNPDSCSSSPQFKVILRSFEFCINGLYMVRSTLLGFKKSVQTNTYDFMKFTKFLVPYTTFLDAKLFYPLYSVDDKNLNWDSKEFFEHFYGGPYCSLPSGGTTVATKETISMSAPIKSKQQLPKHHQNKNQHGTGNGGEESELEHQLQPVMLAIENHPAWNQQNSHTPSPTETKPPRPYTPADFHYIHLQPTSADFHYVHLHQHNSHIASTPSSYSSPYSSFNSPPQI